MDPELTQPESIGGLVRGILMDFRTLIREEVALARVEIREQAARARAAAMSFGIAVGALLVGATFLLIAVAIGLADLLNWPLWAGFLVVAALLALIGAVTFSSGRKQLHEIRAVPAQTVHTLKENSEWIAKRLSSERR